MTAEAEIPRRRLPSPLLTVLWVALVAGVIEGGWRLYQVGVQDKLILMPIHVVWMAPLANLFWIGIPVLLLLLLRRSIPRLVPPAIIFAALLAIGFLPLALLFTSMHKAVALFLALALGVQTSRWMLAHSVGFNRLMRRSVIPLLLLVVLGGGSIGLIRHLRERRMVAGLPAARPGVPNVLLIIWDTVRGQSLSLYGYERPTTPFLDTLAGSATKFTRAMTTAPWTLPSHGSMLTGRRPHELMENVFRPMVDTFPTLAAELNGQGYVTGGFVANMAFTTREHGLARNFSHYRDYRLSPGTLVWSSRLGAVIMGWKPVRRLLNFWDDLHRKNAAQVNDQFLSWVDGRGDRPFFGFLNYYDAHRPYIAVDPHKSLFVRDSTNRFRPRLEGLKFRGSDPEENRWMQDNYDAAIAYQDAAVSRLLAELERRGLLDNTLIIVSSDHGEHWGDHDRLGHMNSLYRQLLQVPLVMRLPGKVPAGHTVTTPVSLVDLPRTVLDLVGAGDSGTIPGISMSRFWPGTSLDTLHPPEPIFSEFATRKDKGPYSLFAQGYHYIAWQGNTHPPQLYDVSRDPLEEEDVAGRPESRAVLRDFGELAVRYVGHRAVERDTTRPSRDDEEPALGQ